MRNIDNVSTDGEGKTRISLSETIAKNRRPLLLLGIVMFLAAFIRVFFAYGVSAGSDFALSGGTSASNNLYALERLLSDGTLGSVISSMYYPYGSANVAPMLFTLVMYPFAAVADLILKDPMTSASFALAISGPLFGLLACIPAYFLGKEVVGNRIGGYCALLFMAFCPIVVQESVFSNGTGISFTLLFAIIGIYFLVKAIKAAGLTDTAREKVEISDYIKKTVLAGVFFAIVGLSWTGFRAFMLPLIAVMTVQTLIDVFRHKNPITTVVCYSVPILMGTLIPAIYYIAVGQWQLVVSGIVVLALFFSAYCASFVAFNNKPWTATVPIATIIGVAIFAIMFFCTPDLFNATVSGNIIMSPEYLGIMGEFKLRLSTLAAYFGWLTFWFLFASVAYRLYNIKENIASPLFIFLIVWPFMMFLNCCHTSSESVIASMAFATAFGLAITWFLGKIDFKGYFASIKNAEGKIKLKKMVKPAPFLALIVAILLIGAPNIIYAVDSGISSNTTSDVNEAIGTDLFGGMGYYVYENDAWVPQEVFHDAGISGTVGAWFEYSDYIAIAGLNSMTDAQGNGSLAVSQALLSEGMDGSSVAAMLTSLLFYNGMTDDVKNALRTSASLTNEEINVIDGALKDVNFKLSNNKTVKQTVVSDVDTYGELSATASDEAIQYMFLMEYFTSVCHGYEVAEAYSAVCNIIGKSYDHFLITGDMIPLYYSNTFTAMALEAGYALDAQNGFVPSFMGIDWTQYYVYNRVVATYTDMMYDSLLYRAYIGMTPEEAGYSSLDAYITAMASADASVKVVPCYGLSNFEPVYWHVKYNPEPSAKADTEGWVEMDASEAIALQVSNGGTINYLSGKPMIISFVGNDVGGYQKIEGRVYDGSVGVEGIQVSAIGADGFVGSTAFTDSDGHFVIKAKAGDTIAYYAASSGTAGALLGAKAFGSVDYDLSTSGKSNVSVALAFGKSTNTYEIDSSDIEASNYTVTFKGKNAGKTYEGPLTLFDELSMVLDLYTVTIKNGTSTVYSGEFTVAEKPSYVALFTINTYSYTVTLEDVYGTAPAGVAYAMLTGTNATEIVEVVNGEATFSVPRGDYRLTLSDSSYQPADWICTNGNFTISSDSSKVVYVEPAAHVTVGSEAYGKVVTFSNNAYTASFIPELSFDVITLPVSDVADTKYTASFIDGTSISYCALELCVGDEKTASFNTATSKLVTGTLKNTSGDDVSGTILFQNGEYQFLATASSGSYSIYLPEISGFIVYATDKSGGYIGEFNASTDSVLDIELKTAKRITAQVAWNTDRYFAYAPVEFDINDGGIHKVFTIHTILNSNTSLGSSSNSAVFYMPEDCSADLTSTVHAYVGVERYLWYLSDDDTPVPTNTKTFDNVTTQTTKKFELKNSEELVVTNDLGYDVSVKVGTNTSTIASGSSHTFEGIKTRNVSVILGTRSTEVVSTDYYFSGTYSFDPEVSSVNLSALLGYADATEAEAVKLKSVYIKNDVTTGVDFIGTESHPGYVCDSGTYEGYMQYTLETDVSEALLRAVNGDKIYYHSIDLTTGPEYFDITALFLDKATISGYVGVIADGTIEAVKDGVTVVGDVEDGSYTLELTPGLWNVTIDVESKGARYSSTGTINAVAGDSKRNFVLDGGSISIPIAVAPIYQGSMAKVEFTIPAGSLVNDEHHGETYTIKPGSGWMDFSASVNDGYSQYSITNIYLPAGEAYGYPITVTGWYNSAVDSIGSKALSVELGSSHQSVLAALYVSDVVSGDLYLDKQIDVVEAYDYSYVIKADNLTGGIANLSINVADSGWLTQIVYTCGSMTQSYVSAGTPLSLLVGAGVSEIKVKYLPTAEFDTVPPLDVTITAGAGIVLKSYTNVDVTIEGDTATFSASPGDASVVAESMTADGRGVINGLSNMPVIVWVMISLIVLLIILIFWMSFKRGVFTRKN